MHLNVLDGPSRKESCNGYVIELLVPKDNRILWLLRACTDLVPPLKIDYASVCTVRCEEIKWPKTSHSPR